MDCMPTVCGYHANSAESCGQFLSGEFNVSHDKTWLGTGMYFWDNKANAVYWLKEKVRKNDIPCIEAGMIVQASIDCSHLLDLTDQDVLDKYSNIWEVLCVLDRGAKISQINDSGVGYRIDFIIKRFPIETSEFWVVRGFGQYEKGGDKRATLLNHPHSHIVDSIRMVYSVRNENAILEREVFREES